MPNINLIAAVRRACAAMALALSISSFPAHAVSVTIDGNLTDLISQVGSSALNTASGTDPQGSADSPTTENNNGFDIKNVYAYYDRPADVLYLGLSVYGTVGNSSAVGASGTTEGVATCGTGSNSRTVFDCNETYGIQLYHGISTSDPQLLLYNVVGLNNGSDTVGATTNPFSLTITRSVSEANNGVEFSISGLLANGAIPYDPYQDLLIRFSAGSADTTGTTTAAEDYHLLQMQVVPVPAAVWLFGSGLVGLIAAARRHRKTA